MDIVATDIGGTNARVAILKDNNIKFIKIYPTREFNSAVELFDKFFKDYGNNPPKYMAVAAAGICENGKIIATNYPWIIRKDELIEAFKLEKCLLLNDFEASAWGLLTIDKDSLYQLGGKEPSKNGVKAILGAGTGLGEAILAKLNDKWHVFRTEGGHCNFAPNSDEEIELLRFLKKKYQHVSFETVLSGKGLLNIYSFLEKKFGIVDKIYHPKEITLKAKNNNDLCLYCINLFCRIYGQEAGNLALKSMATGGVYIYGGIVKHIFEILIRSEFRSEFENKGAMEKLLKNIPVFIVNEPYLALFGGAYCLTYTSMPKAS